MAIWQCCKCGMHNVQCSNPSCNHYQCEGCPQSYTSFLHSDDLDQSTPIASAQTGLQVGLVHHTQAVQQPQPDGNANIYPGINNGLGTFNHQSFTSYAPAQPQLHGNFHIQNNMPSVQPQPISMFMPIAQTTVTAPQTLGAPVQIASQTQMGYQAAGRFTVQGQTQAANITSYTPTGYPHGFSSSVQQPTATGVYRQSSAPSVSPQVLVPSQQNTPRPVQQPTANVGYNQVPTGTMAPPPAPARQTSNRMNASRPAMLRGTRAPVRPHPYKRENPVAAINGQRANSVPRSMNGSATPLRVVSTPPRFHVVDPIPRVSVFTHPAYGMEILNSGVNEEQLLRNQADGIQRLTGVQIPPQTMEEEIRSKIAQMMAEEIRKAGPQVVPDEVQDAVPQIIPEEIQSAVPQMVPEEIHGAPPQMMREETHGVPSRLIPEGIQGGHPQTMPEEIQERDPHMMPDEILNILPEGMYKEARALLGTPEPATARLAPMQVPPAASQPTQWTVDYRSIDWQGGWPCRVSPLSGMGVFLSGLDPGRLFRGTGIRPAKPGEVPTLAFVPTGQGAQMQAVTAGTGTHGRLGGGTGEEEEEGDEDDSEDEESEEEESEEEGADGEEEGNEEGGVYIKVEEEGGEEDAGEEEQDDEDEDDEDGGAPLNAHWQGNDGGSGPDRQVWYGQTGGFGAPFYQGKM